MKLPVYIFCCLLLISSCSNRITNEAAVNAGIVMKLSADKTKISQAEKTVNLTIKIKNKSANLRYLLNLSIFSSYDDSDLQLIIEKDKKRKIAAGPIFGWNDPSFDHYKKLLPGDSLTFNYELNVSMLTDEFEKYGRLNEDFGTYKIKVIFRDIYKDLPSLHGVGLLYDWIFPIRKRAVTFLESNTVEIEYVK